MSNSSGNGTGSFNSRFGAIMSMTGMCVGMGSVWRFPYMVGQYGGGSFIVAYIACMLIVVLPLGIIECGIGKGFEKGMIGVFTDALKNKTAGKIFGAIFSLGYFSMNFFYYVVLAASTYFIYSSATSEWNRTSPELIYEGLAKNTTLIAVISLILVVATIYIIIKGVDSGIERMSKIMIPLMFIFFIVVVFFGIFFIDGIQQGYNWYIEPDLAILAKPDIWIAAMSQALFAVGVGPGCVLIYGSHLKKTSDVTLNMTTVCLLTCSVGVIVGMALIPACIALNLNPESGSMLIYVIIPTLLSKIPGGAVVGILLFLAIFFAGFSTAIAQTEVAVATFATDFNWGRKKAGLFFGVINVVAAVIAAYSIAFYDFWNNFSGNYLFIGTAGIGAIVYVYIINAEKVRRKFLNPSSDIRMGEWFSKYAKIIAAPIMIIIMINSLFPIFLSSETSFTKGDVPETLTVATIITLAVIVLGLFGITIKMLHKCLTTEERTEEEVLTYEREQEVPIV
ncbi:sodium-dependent transporter [Anaerotignum propionicum]|uniref:sodium-dependent transporter n=1 Tax=Anaerotignum propionicum TaxID=28446 RepID=UPI002109BD26|nr:sodium-dependent transporter [Anaerotignum propionicum]MCQ4936028.1 sodium-dependent transporter [Anaerotignum propionicum]